MSFNGSAGGHLCSVYFAPRGRDRIYQLGMQIAQQHLSPADRIIGVIGEAGSGKSMIIKGMFPGLELTNDDEGVNVRPLPLLCQDDENRFYSPHTYHMDARFELGFTQLHVLVDAIREAVARGKRVIIEHFDLVYEALGFNADLIVGIGEEVIVTRPNIFGPLPEDVAKVVHKSVHTRLMAHTAEDLCEFHMPEKEVVRCLHADIKSGFLMAFHDSPPEVDLEELEKAVLADIAADPPVEYVGTSLSILHRTERTARWGKGRIGVQATYAGYAAMPRSQADDDPAMEAGLSAAVAWLYGFRPVGRWTFALGGMAEAESGFTYLVRGGNNPAQGRLAVHLGLTGRVVRPFRVGRQQWEARAQVDVPLIGAMFTPNYGQSYYEIFSLGHYDKNIRATHPWNAPSARLTATLTLPLWGAHLSLGYNGEARQSHVNHLKHHTWNHHFIIGYVRTLRLLR